MKISIITTTYNRKELLRQTIDAVQRSVLIPRTDIDWEHIVYDDGSTDGTEALFQGDPWPRVVFIRGEGNKGPSYGRNAAIAQATGDYILPLDDDDIILQRTLYNFADAVTAHPDARWFAADFLHVDDELRYRVGEDYHGWPFSSIKETLEAIFKGEHFLQGNVLYRKSLLEEVGRYDEGMRMAEDLDLYVRFLLAGHLMRVVPFISHLHRFHGANVSQDLSREEQVSLIRSLREKYGQA